MKSEAIKEFYIVNGELESATNTKFFENITKPPKYEVIRVIDGVPLFLEDHLKRMRQSAYIINYQIERRDNKIEIK